MRVEAGGRVIESILKQRGGWFSPPTGSGVRIGPERRWAILIRAVLLLPNLLPSSRETCNDHAADLEDFTLHGQSAEVLAGPGSAS